MQMSNYILLLITLTLFHTVQSCSKDCPPEELTNILVQTTNEEGKLNALSCSVTTEERPEPIIIELGKGYILGMTICEGDQTELEKLPGVLFVEPDHIVSIANP